MRRGHQPPTKADETPEFKELWEVVWPHVKSPFDGRAAARDAFFRHVWWKGSDPKDIVDGAKAYVRSAKLDGPRLKLDSWLDRGMYEDLAEAQRAHEARMMEAQQRKAQASPNVVQMPAAASMTPEKRAEMRDRLKGLSVSLRNT